MRSRAGPGPLAVGCRSLVEPNKKLQVERKLKVFER